MQKEMALFGEAQAVTLAGKKVSCSQPELIILDISRTTMY
jgi:hypothetical protein